MPSRLLACLAVAGTLSAEAAAIQMMLDPRAIEEAVAIGRSGLERERAAFHAPYRILVSRAPVDYLDVVTPFRRVVLGAEARLRGGERAFGQREALEMLAVSGHQLDVYVELTFHPLNTFIGVPGYDVLLTAVTRADAVEPLGVDRVPRYGQRVDGALPDPTAARPILPGGSQPMLGGTLIARFDLRLLEANGAYEVVVSDGGKELARGRVDFGKLR